MFERIVRKLKRYVVEDAPPHAEQTLQEFLASIDLSCETMKDGRIRVWTNEIKRVENDSTRLDSSDSRARP